MTELDRRDFLHLSLGAVLLPAIPSFALESASPCRIVIQYEESLFGAKLTKAFSLTYAQMFEGEPVEPLTMTAVQACTVTGAYAEFPFIDIWPEADEGQTRRVDMLWPSSRTGRAWPLLTGETITLVLSRPIVAMV